MDRDKKAELLKGYTTDYPIKDELDWLLQKYTPEQIKELMESVMPKPLGNNTNIPMVFGTDEDLPPFKEGELTWSNLWEYKNNKNG